MSSRLDLSGETWVRPDGVGLFANAADMLGVSLQLAPIQITASGLARNTEVWTGLLTGAASTPTATTGPIPPRPGSLVSAQLAVPTVLRLIALAAFSANRSIASKNEKV